MDLIRARRSLAPLENLRFWVADCGIGGIGACQQPPSSGKEQLEWPPSAHRTQRDGEVWMKSYKLPLIHPVIDLPQPLAPQVVLSAPSVFFVAN